MKVLVSDLVEFLQQFPQDTEVVLDKDGWVEALVGVEPMSVQELIKNRGLFMYIPWSKPILVLNN